MTNLHGIYDKWRYKPFIDYSFLKLAPQSETICYVVFPWNMLNVPTSPFQSLQNTSDPQFNKGRAITREKFLGGWLSKLSLVSPKANSYITTGQVGLFSTVRSKPDLLCSFDINLGVCHNQSRLTVKRIHRDPWQMKMKHGPLTCNLEIM